MTFGAALLLQSLGVAHAMGFGRSVTSTTLGQPLDFFVQLAVDGEEAAELPCVAAEVRVGDAKVAPEQVRATIEGGRGAGDLRVRVTTRTGIDEPVVAVDVTVGCASRVSRRFVAFVDPPALRLASTQRNDFVPQRADPQVAPLVAIVERAHRARRGDGPRRTAAGRSSSAYPPATSRLSPGRGLADASSSESTATHAGAPLGAATKPPRRGSHSGGAAMAARPGPRLRLEAALPTPPARPAVAIAGAAVAVAAVTATPSLDPPSPADADGAAALAAERSRIAGLEAALAQLHADAQTQQKTLATLQARLRQTESERDAKAWTGMVAIGLLFLVVFTAAYAALRRQQRRRAHWFEEQTRQLQRESVAASPAEAESPAPRVSQPPSGWNEGPHSILPVTAPAAIGGLEVTTVLAPQSYDARTAPQEASANAATRTATPAVSPMDELADLEQQAEFFAVIGQDDAAVALLEAHLREQSSSSPLPYLHLLDIHRRLGHRGAFERVRIEHGARFAAVAVAWEASDADRLALDDHAPAVRSLQSLWTTPPEAMRLIEALLLRTNESQPAFDLAAYRDLLFLYAVARDLATPPEADNGSIDLYLPLDDAPTEPLRRQAVDVDMSDWQDLPEQELVVRRAAGRRGAG